MNIGTYKQSSNIKTLESKYKLNILTAITKILLPSAKVRNSSFIQPSILLKPLQSIADMISITWESTH